MIPEKYSIKFRLRSPRCGGTDRQSPARAEQIHRNLLYDVSVLLFPWFEPWLDNRLKTFVMCSPTDYWETRWQQHSQPYIQDWVGGVGAVMTTAKKMKCPCVTSYYTVNRIYTINCTVMHVIAFTNMSVSVKTREKQWKESLDARKTKINGFWHPVWMNLDTVNLPNQYVFFKKNLSVKVWWLCKSVLLLIGKNYMYIRH